MAEERAQRHLAAIFAADVVGYTRLMEQDEADTFARLRAHRKELFEPEIEKHQGHVFKLMGDGLLAEFGSVVDAVECAVALQRGMAERNNGVPEDRRIDVRIGINLGDVIVEGADRHGEGVNIATRLQELAEPGGICLSQQAFDQVETKLDLTYDNLGEHLVKNIVKPVHVYRVRGEAARARRRLPARRPSRLATIAGGLVVLTAIAGAMMIWIVWPPECGGVPCKPRIAVLPFADLRENPEGSFSDGLTKEIGTALSKFSDVVVISGDSTRRFKGENVDPQYVGSELDARYVLAGSINGPQGGLRVTAQLYNAENGQLLQSANIDENLTAAGSVDIQDRVAGLVAGRIASPQTPLWESEARWASEKLPDHMLARAAQWAREQMGIKRADSLVAYKCVLLSYALGNSFTKEVHGNARDCLEHAVELVPTYAIAWARLGSMYFEEYKYKWNLLPDPLGRARAAAQKSIELDQHIPDGYYVLADVHFASESDFRAVHETAEKAIAINPNNAFIVADLGIWTFYSGAWERGTTLIERAKRLNPDYPRWLDFAFVLDHYRKHEYLEAKAIALKIDLPKNHMVQAALAAAYGELGESDKARNIIAQILTIKPSFADDPRAEFKARRMPDELVESLMDGLRKAGLDVPAADP